MLRRLPAWSIRSTSNRPASSRRRTIIAAIIDALLAAIIAGPIIMVLLALPIIMAAFITVIIAMPIIMAVFIIAIIAVLLAVLIAGVIITETVGVALGWSRTHTRGQSSPRATGAPLTGAFFLERRRVTTGAALKPLPIRFEGRPGSLDTARSL